MRKLTEKQKVINQIRSTRLKELIEEVGKDKQTILCEISAMYEVQFETLERILDCTAIVIRSGVMLKITAYFRKELNREINWEWLNGGMVQKYLDIHPTQPMPTSFTERNTEIIRNLLKIPLGKFENVYLTKTELEYLYDRFGMEKTNIAVDVKSECIINGTDLTATWPSDYYSVFQMLKREEERRKKMQKKRKAARND